MAPTLFNIYTNDQSRVNSVKYYVYANNSEIAVQEDTFEAINV